MAGRAQDGDSHFVVLSAVSCCFFSTASQALREFFFMVVSVLLLFNTDSLCLVAG